MKSNDAPKIVIVGGVAGGASAATRARRLNEHAQIVIYEKDPYVSFANCGLPYYIGGEIAERARLLVAPLELLRRRFRLDVRPRHEVRTVDRAAKRVVVREGETGKSFEDSYDRLILATGGEPVLPAIDGASASNVFTLRTLSDADRIRSRLEASSPAGDEPRRAVVVGAGYVGLEMVEQLARMGLRVTVVELLDQVLPVLDPEMARMLQLELEANGVDVRVRDGIRSLRIEGGAATGVVLSSGSLVPTDLVVLGMGVRPSVKLAVAAGLSLGPSGGIAVNEFFQTSDPAIYAVGDAVEYPYGPTGERRRVALAGPANRAGRIAGEHAATGTSKTPMASVQGTSVVRVFDLTAAATGLSAKEARRLGLRAQSVTIRALHHAGYFPGAKPLSLKLVFDPDSGRILGAQAIGQEGVDKRIDVVATALHFRGTVRDLAGLDLAYAPPYGSAKDPVHMAAFAACNVLDGFVRVRQPAEDMDGVQFVDVRTPAEVAALPCQGAVHIPLDDLRERVEELDIRRPTVVTCLSGQRSYMATRILAANGFTDVSNLTGGATIRRMARPEDFPGKGGSTASLR